jgi:signal peptidase I
MSSAPAMTSATASDVAGDTGEAPDGEAKSSPAGRGRHYRRRKRDAFLSWILVLLVAGALAVGLRLFVVQTFYVPSASMVPTLQVGDRMLVLKPPKDTSDTAHEDLVKRVIGLPGETISSVGNTVYIDGKPLSEPWLPKNTVLGQAIPRQTIPPGCYFMMGDNRSDSFDSRDWGVLPRRLIVGEVLVVIWRDGGPVFHIQ